MLDNVALNSIVESRKLVAHKCRAHIVALYRSFFFFFLLCVTWVLHSSCGQNSRSTNGCKKCTLPKPLFCADTNIILTLNWDRAEPQATCRVGLHRPEIYIALHGKQGGYILF